MNFRRDRVVLRILIRHRRAAMLAAAVTGGCLALTACGPVQLGSAAIVGGQRITTSTLTTQVANLSGYYDSHHGKVQLGFPASQTPQQVLGWLIRFAVGDKLASREGISVSPGDIQRAISQITAQEAESGSASLTVLAVDNGLPPDLINSGLGRFEAIENLVIAHLDGGVNPTSATAEQALENQFNTDECQAAKSLNIKVNPQFGRLDYSQFTIVAAANTLSAPEPGASPSPSASPTSAPRYTPPC
jgi:SurA N-terminal domain